MTPQTVDAQRDVVKNERRQRVENEPYGIASVVLDEMLYPAGPSVPLAVIGYMEDLTAATLRRRGGFFKSYYGPSNARLVVAGDIDPPAARRLVEKWFSDVKPGTFVPPLSIPGVALTSVQKKTITDNVQLPRLYLAWLTPRMMSPGDAALDVVADVLAGGKNSRLYKRLVYDMQIAQSVQAYQRLAGAVVVVHDRGDAAARAHRRRTAEGHRRRNRQAAARSPDRVAKSPGRSIRSSRRSTAGWSGSAASAEKRIS